MASNNTYRDDNQKDRILQEHKENIGKPPRNLGQKATIAQALESYGRKIDIPQNLQARHTLGIIRHGKTKSKKEDNEAMAKIDENLVKDAPKGKDIPLDEQEFLSATSCLYAQVERIKQLGFKKIVLYAPHDTLRNIQSIQLLEKYGVDLGMEVITQQQHYPLLSARKKRELSKINELLDTGDITNEQLDSLGFGSKHILGATRILDLPGKEKQKFYEESYTQTIQNAADGLDQIKSIIGEQIADPETLHLVVAYRTTIQAGDIKNSGEREKEGIDLHYSGSFAELKTYPLNNKGQFQQREWEQEHKSLMRIPQDDYQVIIHKLQELFPTLSLNQSVTTNEGIINQYLYQLEGFIEERLERNHTNIILYYIQQYPLVGDVIIDQLLSVFRRGLYTKHITQIITEFLQGAYLEQTPEQQLKTLRLLHSSSPKSGLRKQAFSILWHSGRSILRKIVGENEEYDFLYKQLEASDTFLSSEIFNVESLTFGSIDFFKIYKDQKLSIDYGEGRKQPLLNSDLLIMKGNKYITAPGGSGKSMLAKYLVSEHVRNGLHPENISLIHAGDIDISQLHRIQVVVIDGIDEVGIKEQIMRNEYIDANPEKKFYCLGRSFLTSVWGEQQTIKLEASLDNVGGVVDHYADILPNHTSKHYKKFMQQIIPKLNPKDINYMIIDALGLISQSRSAYELVGKESISRQEVYRYYLEVLGEATFEKYKELDESIFENDLLDRKYDIVRKDFLKYLSVYVGNDWKTNIDSDTVSLGFYATKQFKRAITLYMNECNYPDLVNRINNQGGYTEQEYQKLERKREELFTQSLVVSGVIEKSSMNGVNGYRFSHKTVLDYFRSLCFDPKKVLESQYFQEIKTMIEAKETIDNNLGKTFFGSIQVEDYKEFDEIGPRLHSLLDALHFDNYKDLVEVVTKISLELENDEVNRMLYHYLYDNHKEIFISLSNDVEKKYPDAPRSHRYSYYGGLESYFCGFSQGYGGPGMREHLCSRVGIGINSLVNPRAASGGLRWLSGYIKRHLTTLQQTLMYEVSKLKDSNKKQKKQEELDIINNKIASINTMNKKEMKDILIKNIEENFKKLEDICYGPITENHAMMLLIKHCFDDAEEDVEAAQKIISEERAKGNRRFMNY